MSHALLAIGFGIVAATAPRPLACSIQLTDSPNPYRNRPWWFVGGAGLVLVLAAVVVVIVSRIVIAAGAAPSERVDSSDVLLGSAILAAVVIGLLVRSRRNNQPALLTDHMDLTPRQCLWAGTGVMASGIAPLALFLAAINELVLHGGDWVTSYLLLLATIVLVLLPGMVPPLLETLAPNRVDRISPGLFQWALRPAPWVSAGLFTLCGAFLLIRGLTG